MIPRREFLVLTAASVAVPAAVKAQIDPNLAANRKAAFQEALRKGVGDAQVQRGRGKLHLPPLVGNGNSVPPSVAVESPMTGTDHVNGGRDLADKRTPPDVV